jgi:hypothetical protein
MVKMNKKEYIEARKRAKQKYRKSLNGKLIEKAYRKRNKEKLYRMKIIYRNSPKGRFAERKYRISNKRKAVLQRYEQSDKGRITSILRTLRYEEKQKLGKSPIITRKDYMKIFELFNNKCFNCSSKYKLCLEHHNPLIYGYSIFYNGFNASVLCNNCNTYKKKRKMPEQFYSKEKIKEYGQIKKKWIKWKSKEIK